MSEQDISAAGLSHLSPKWILKGLLRRFGYDVVRYDPESIAPLNVLDLAIERVCRKNEKFFFVQVGANDGVRHDPIRHLVLKYRLKGLLVEPLPDFYAALQANYADLPQLQFANVAIGAENGVLRLLRFRADAPLHDDLHGVATLDEARIRKFARKNKLEHYLEEVEVPCITPAQLLRQHAVKRIDLLQIDVEGHEFEILRGFIDAGILPTIVNLEFLHLTPDERIATQRLLVQEGYSYVYTGIDLLAMRPPPDSGDLLAPPARSYASLG